MPYSATAYRLLTSCPGDIPTEDIEAVREAVGRFNANYGREFGAVVVPLHWTADAVAEHGSRPQEVINTQLVDEADVVIVLFWGRLGSPTGEEISGTVEELEKAIERGAYGAILHCQRDLPADVDAEQLTAVRKYLEEARKRSFIQGYNDRAVLGRHVEAILNRAVSHDHGRVEAAVAAAPSAQVWPKVERSDRTESDSKGQVKTKTRWSLVLRNTGGEPARNVKFRLEPEQEGEMVPEGLSDGRPIEVLPPDGDVSYPLMLHTGIADQARCVVTWTDSNGEQTNSATARFF